MEKKKKATVKPKGRPVSKGKKPEKKTNPDIKKLASRIKQLRIDAGYSNADFFAYDNDITRSQYSRYETGEDIRFSSLMKLIKAFGITPQEFFADWK